MEPTHDNAVVQEIDVSTIVEEEARQLREMAEARGVETRVSSGLPWLTVDVGVWSWYLSICSRTRSRTAMPQNLYATGKSPAKRRMVTDVLASCATTVSAFPKKPFASIFRRFTLFHPQREMKSVAWVSASRLSKIAKGRWVERSKWSPPKASEVHLR